VIAKHARAMAGALAGAQQRVRELERLLVDGQIEMARLRGEIEDEQNERARMQVERDEFARRMADVGLASELLNSTSEEISAEPDLDPGADEDEEQGDLDFDPEDIPF
jgi:hypothetical protein